MTPFASDHVSGSRARGRTVAAILGAGLLLSGVSAAAAPAKTPVKLPPVAKDIASVGNSSLDPSKRGQRPDFVPGELLVRFKDGAQRSDARRSENAKLKQHLPGVDGLELLQIERGRSPEAAARSFESRSDVQYAEPNYIYRALATTNDSRLAQYWGHNNTGQTVNGITGTADADMDIFEAWNIQQSSPNVIVAVIDSGVAYDHPDLAANMWSNPGEACTAALPNRCRDGVDNDGNGFKDDVRGADTVGANDGDPRDENGHGTHVAGTIAARGNNDVAGANATDGVGVSTQAKIQAIRVLDASGSGASSDIIEGYNYARLNGAKVANASLGGLGFSQAASDAIKAAESKVLFVIAAGNGASDGIGDNNDTTGTYPCSYSAPTNIICVAATNSKDQFTGFSNYGATSVDVAAPGENILSTYPAFRTVWSDSFTTDPFNTRWTRGGTPNTWAHAPNDYTSNGAPAPAISDSPGGFTYAPSTDNWARRTTGANLTGLTNCALEAFAIVDTEAYFDDPQNPEVYDVLWVEAATNSAGPWTVIGVYYGSGQGQLSDALGTFSGKSNVFVRYALTSDESEEWDGAYIFDPALKCLGTSYNASDFHFENGTSMASPYTAGVAALMFGKFPTLTVAQARARMLQGVDVKAALNQPGKKVATGGRVNAYKVLSQTSASVASGALTVTAGTGSTNGITVTRLVEGGVVKHRVSDPYGLSGSTGSRVVPGAGCVADTATTVKCTGVTSVKVLAGDLNDTVNTSTVTVRVNVDGGLGNDTITTGAGADTLTGGLGADRFTSGGANDIINAKDDVADLSFACGETAGDSDRVNGDATPNDPVTQSATNCEVVSKL